MSQIGLAVLGAGVYAGVHLKALLGIPTVSVKAIYSRSKSSAAGLAEAFQLPGTVDIFSTDSAPSSNLEALLQRQDITAALICLPITAQPAIVRQCLLANKHVISEKPVASDVSSAQTLVDFYRALPSSSNLIWAVAENFRFQEALRYARREADKFGQLLTLRAVNSYDFSKTPFGKTEWRLNPEHNGGILLDGGVHLLAATRLLLGEDKIETIGALATGLGETKDTGDRISATFKTAGGAVGVVFISYLGPDTLFEYTIACEKGTVFLRNGVVTVQSKAGEERTDFGFGPIEAGVKPELEAFVDSILKGRPDARQTPEQALDDVYLTENMLESARNDGNSKDVKAGWK